MKTVTYDEFLTWNPCWMQTPEGRRKLRYYAQKRERWSALNILALNRVSAEDRLWAVLREELIDAPILHEFACRCVEMALALIPNPDPRSVAAIEAKRKWMRGEITDEELAAARDAATEVTARDAAARYNAAWAAAWVTEWAAEWAATRKNQVKILKQLLEAEK